MTSTYRSMQVDKAGGPFRLVENATPEPGPGQVRIAVVAYFYWRDFGRREISTWPQRAAWVFYGAVALLVVDLGWWMLGGLAGRDLLAAILVAAACGHAGYRTWRDQKNLV